MRYVVKILRYVSVYYLYFPIPKVNVYIIHGLVGVFFRSESIGVFLKIRFKYRFYYYLYRHLHYPVLNCRYPKRPLAAICLRNVCPSDRLRLLSLVLQFLSYAFKIPLLPAFHLLYVLKGYPVYSTGSFVCSNKFVGMAQNVPPVSLVIEKIEYVLFLLLVLLI